MKTICFFPDGGMSFFQIEVQELSGIRQKESLIGRGPNEWINDKISTGLLSESDQLVLVVPEIFLLRRIVKLPQARQQGRQENIILSWLQTELGEEAGAWRWEAIKSDAQNDTLFAVCAVKKLCLHEWMTAFGTYADRLLLVGEGEWRLRNCTIPDTGYIQLTQVPEQIVLACDKGRVIDGRVSQTEDVTNLYYTLRQIHESMGLSDLVDAPMNMAYETKNKVCTFQSDDFLKKKVPKREKKTLLFPLFVGCVILPVLAIIYFSNGVNQQEEILQTPVQESVKTVVQSQYSDLMIEADEAKTERVNVNRLEAVQNSLFISGTCKDSLDLADYLKRLEEISEDSMPLLTELSREVEKDKAHYAFVIRLAKEGEIAQ